MEWSNLPALAPVGLDLTETEEEDLILSVAGLLKHDPAVTDFDGMVRDLLIRQREGPPLLGNGIALPHARSSCVSRTLLAIARSRSEVPFGPSSEAVRLIFLFVTPSCRPHESLAMTAILARMLRHPPILEALLSATDPESFRSHLR